MNKCIKCKGKNPELCGRTFCPIVAKSQAIMKIKKNHLKDDFAGSSPTPFVGRFGYPNINVGILSVDKPDSWQYDAPRHWSQSDLNIKQIVDLRSALVNSRFKINVKKQSKFLEISQEVGMASKPVQLEVKLDKKPSFRLNTDPFMAPTGPNAKLKKAQITSNPKVHTKVDKVVSDTDFKATGAVKYLYKNDFDENMLTRLLSIGNLGVKKNRRLVPTRWSITAVDDILGKDLIKQVKDYSCYDYAAYFGGYLGNYYLILFFPDVWSYELFEMYQPKASWNISENMEYSTDYEPYFGRKSYASNTVGGYYAARLGILEKLSNLKKQASVLALRFITGEYYLPLGVWVVRQATRKALQNKPYIFESRRLMLSYAEAVMKKKFGIRNFLKNSRLLKEMKTQKKVIDFI
ncbi:MAG: DNA repair protein NreA [Candidatus Woesearchaeota archaeon]|nr:DNA repair protein NreA [Candidatus Woesearchaeota archaeon]